MRRHQNYASTLIIKSYVRFSISSNFSDGHLGFMQTKKFTQSCHSGKRWISGFHFWLLDYCVEYVSTQAHAPRTLACTHTQTHARAHTHANTQKHTQTHTRARSRTHAHTDSHTRANRARMNAHTYVISLLSGEKENEEEEEEEEEKENDNEAATDMAV